MNIYKLATAAYLLTMLVGCQSASWKTALGTRFGRDKPSKVNADKEDAPNDVQLVSGDKLNPSGRYRGRRSAGGERLAANSNSAHDVNSILRKGHAAEEGGQLNQAKMFYRQALDTDPKNPLAHHRLAIIADKEGEFKQAEEHYLNALGVQRNDPNLLSDLGYSFLLQNRRNESKYYLQKALEADPSHLRALNNLGLLEARQGNYDAALATFRKTGSERDAQAKMSELFPNGRPQGVGNPSAADSTFAGIRQQSPQVTPAGGPAPWEQGAAGGHIQPVGGPPSTPSIQPNPSARPFPDIAQTQQPSQVGGFNNQATPSHRPQANPFPPEPPHSNGTPSQNSGQAASDPFPTVEVWPPVDTAKTAPAPQRGLPVTPSPAAVAGNSAAATQPQGAPLQQGGGQLPAVTNSATNGQPVNSGQPATPIQIDPRQRAAMMGLNAGLSGAFPVTHGGQHQQHGQPTEAPTGNGQGNSPQFQPTAPATPMNSVQPFPSQTTSQVGQPASHYPSPATQPTTPSDSRYRTVARPVSPPTGNYYQPQGGQPIQPVNPQNQQQYQQRQSYRPPAQQPAGNGAYTQPNSQQYQQIPSQPQPQYHPQPAGTQHAPAQQYRGNYNTNPNTAAPQQFNPNNTYQPGR